jgi:hypothetical protein
MMKVFLSYRRDDTGGRSGRLFDVLAAKYGPRNVFQDVTSAAPGRDFVAALDSAIAGSDAVLVVIGPQWLSRTTDGVRRIDQPDDFVRIEVGEALAADIAVVPVLVDGGVLPAVDELPAEIAGLVRRQAVQISDETWHQDVDALIRRLEGELLATGGPRRRWWWALIAAAVVVVVVGVGGVILTRDRSESADSGPTPPCPSSVDGWTPLDVDTSGTTYPASVDAFDVDVAVVGAFSRAVGAGSPTVLVDVEVANRTSPAPGSADEYYVGVSDFDGLVVDGFDQGPAVCVSTSNDPQLAPDERTIATVGFDSAVDPTGAAVVLKTFDDVDVVVAQPSEG